MQYNQLYIGWDLHTKDSMFAVLNANGNELDYSRMPTEEESITQYLLRWDAQLNVAVEVGSMIHWAVDILKRISANYYVINTSAFKLLTHSRKKTDRRDAYLMAYHYYKDNLPEPVFIPEQRTIEVRTLLHARLLAVKQSIMMMNSTRGLLKRIGFKFKDKYFKIPQNWQLLLESGLPDYLCNVVSNNYSIWYKQENAVVEYTNQLLQYFKDDDNFALLQTIPAIGPITAIAILASMDNINRFANAGKLASYFGLVPTVRQSGERTHHGRITKMGNSLVRRYLTEVTNSLIGNKFRLKYNKECVILTKLKNGYYKLLNTRDSKNVAKVALAHKLVFIIYHVLKKGEAFNPNLWI